MQGAHATKTAEIASLAGVGVSTLLRTFPTKEALLQGTYEHAIQHLTAPLQAGEGEAQRNECLHQLLERWWQLTAQAALAYSEAFDVWQLVRTMPRAALPADPLTGALCGHTGAGRRGVRAQSLARRKGRAAECAHRFVGRSMDGRGGHGAAGPRLSGRAGVSAWVLTLAYKGWWRSLGLSTSLSASWQAAPAKPRPKPKPEVPV